MKLLLSTLIALVMLVSGIELPAAEIPDEIKEMVPVYPEATVGTCDTSTRITRVKLETTAAPKEVFAFYKKEMSARGWTLVHEKASPDQTRLVMTRGELQFGFGSYNIPKRGTMFFFSIKDMSEKP